MYGGWADIFFAVYVGWHVMIHKTSFGDDLHDRSRSIITGNDPVTNINGVDGAHRKRRWDNACLQNGNSIVTSSERFGGIMYYLLSEMANKIIRMLGLGGIHAQNTPTVSNRRSSSTAVRP